MPNVTFSPCSGFSQIASHFKWFKTGSHCGSQFVLLCFTSFLLIYFSDIQINMNTNNHIMRIKSLIDMKKTALERKFQLKAFIICQKLILTSVQFCLGLSWHLTYITSDNNTLSLGPERIGLILSDQKNFESLFLCVCLSFCLQGQLPQLNLMISA